MNNYKLRLNKRGYLVVADQNGNDIPNQLDLELSQGMEDRNKAVVKITVIVDLDLLSKNE